MVPRAGCVLLGVCACAHLGMHRGVGCSAVLSCFRWVNVGFVGASESRRQSYPCAFACLGLIRPSCVWACQGPRYTLVRSASLLREAGWVRGEIEGGRHVDSLADDASRVLRSPLPRSHCSSRPRTLTKWRSTTRLETRTKESNMRASVWVR